MASFKPFHYVMGAELVTHWAVVLTPKPRILEIGDRRRSNRRCRTLHRDHFGDTRKIRPADASVSR